MFRVLLCLNICKVVILGKVSKLTMLHIIALRDYHAQEKEVKRSQVVHWAKV